MIARQGQATEGFENSSDSVFVILLKAVGRAVEPAWRDANRCDSDYQGTLSRRRLPAAFAIYSVIARALIAMHALLRQVRNDFA
jgi:hypothetical protein